MDKFSLCVLPGDGIGKEVTEAVLTVLEQTAAQFDFKVDVSHEDIGGASIDKHKSPLTDKALKEIKRADAVFLGAVGGPKWDNLTGDMRPESGLLKLRKELGVYANLRPVKIHPQLSKYSPLKEDILTDVDILVVRELTGGLYFGKPKEQYINDGGTREAIDTLIYDEHEIRRIAKKAFEMAEFRKKRVMSVDKANVLASSRLWRDVVTELSADYPNIELEHMLVDNCAMQLVKNPSQFDVILTENMFGDILSDEAAMLTGSIGMLPSASIGDKGGLFEPVHGSAPDIAGKYIANPLASIASLALLMRYAYKREDAALAIESAIANTLEAGYRCADLATEGDTVLGTNEMADVICNQLAVSGIAVW